MQVTGAENNNVYLENNKKKPVQTLDKDTFLQLFITQLRYQNPASPQDTNEFASQMAQFTMLEQLTNLTTTMEELLEMNQLSHASTLIGREVVVAKDETFINGSVDKVTIDKEGVKIWVSDEGYTLDKVISVLGLPEDTGNPEEGGGASDSEQVQSNDTPQQSTDNPA
ncbi:MAG: flagellar hook assembly protein FlgD [Bacillota bacterium]